MARYFVIAPFSSKSSHDFQRVWQYDLLNSVISIGWEEIGDVSRLSRDQLLQVIAAEYGYPPHTNALVRNMLWLFYHEIQPGDFVIARRGKMVVAGVGEVVSSAEYTRSRRNADAKHSG